MGLLLQYHRQTSPPLLGGNMLLVYNRVRRLNYLEYFYFHNRIGRLGSLSTPLLVVRRGTFRRIGHKLLPMNLALNSRLSPRSVIPVDNDGSPHTSHKALCGYQEFAGLACSSPVCYWCACLEELKGIAVLR